MLEDGLVLRTLRVGGRWRNRNSTVLKNKYGACGFHRCSKFVSAHKNWVEIEKSKDTGDGIEQSLISKAKCQLWKRLRSNNGVKKKNPSSLTLKHAFYSREIRNFLEMSSTGAATRKNIFTTNKSIGDTTQFLKHVEPLMRNAFDSSLEGKFYLAVKLGWYF